LIVSKENRSVAAALSSSAIAFRMDWMSSFVAALAKSRGDMTQGATAVKWT